MIDRSSKEYYAKYKWVILAVIVFMPFMAMLDSTIVNVALPVMAKDLHTDMESVQMVVIVYLIAVVSTVLLFGRLGDIKGKGRMFMFGTVLFTIGSLLAGLSHDLNMLIVARIVEGVGGAAALANNQGIITEVFPGNERGRALGIGGVAVAFGTMLGPALGGLIVTYLNWNYIFLINVPIGIVGFLFALKFLPRGKRVNETLDYKGAIFFAAAMVAFFFALQKGESVGYDKPYIIVLFLLAAVFVVAFLFIEKKSSPPLLDLTLFKNPLFAISLACTVILYFGINGINIIQPFYIEDVLKIDPGKAGLIMASLPIAMGIMSPIAGTISDKIGQPKVILVGLIMLTIGIALLSSMTIKEPIEKLVIYLCIVGAGAGCFTAPSTSLIMSTSPKEKLGITGSMNQFTRNFGSVMGISLLTALLYSLMSAKAGYHVDGFIKGDPEIFVYGMQSVYLIGAGIITVSVVLMLIVAIKYKKLRNKYQNLS